jgi:hypothetical protein
MYESENYQTSPRLVDFAEAQSTASAADQLRLRVIRVRRSGIFDPKWYARTSDLPGRLPIFLLVTRSAGEIDEDRNDNQKRIER